jgi:apoptosis-inducing factor 3
LQRQEGFTGRIVMICKKPTLPYNRIKLSKKMELKPEENLLRSEEFYKQNDIETMLGVEATKVDSQAKEVTCSNGYVLKYDKMYVATGSEAKKVSLPGADRNNVVVLQTHEHADSIQSKLTKDSHVVVLG